MRQGLSHVEESHAGRSKQVFQSTAHIEIKVHCLYVYGARAAVLIVVEQHQRATVTCDSYDVRRRCSKAVAKTNVRERHNQGSAVDCGFVGLYREAFVLCVNERDFRTPPCLG